MVRHDLEHGLFFVGEFFAAFLLVKDFGNLRVSHIAGHNHRALEAEAGLHRILGKVGEHFLHRAVKVDFNCRSEVHGIACRNVVFRMVFHLFEPEAVLVNLCLDVTVSRAAHTDRNRAACSVARSANHANVVHQVLAAELSANARLLANVENLFFHFEVAENTAAFGTAGRNIVEVAAASELHHVRVHFGRGSANHDREVVRRASGSTERLHLFGEELFQGLRVEERLGHGPVVSLVGRATALRHKEELHLGAFFGVDVDLGRQVATGVLFFVHRERSNLAVAQVLRRVGVVDTFGNGFSVIKARPDLLALVGYANSRTRVLAERENALGGNAGVLEHGEGDKLVVVRSFRILEDLCDLRRVSRTEAEFNFFESSLSDFCQSFLRNLENLLTFEFGDRNAIFTEIYVFGSIFTVLDGSFVFECHSR